MPGPDDPLDAWHDLCRRLAALGDEVLGEDGPSDPRARAEGVRHLANQVACWLTYGIGHTDVTHPTFFRSADPVYRWGGPNVDQVARRAPIDGTGRYVVAGEMGSAEDFVLQVKLGAVQTGGAEVAAELYGSKIGLGTGDRFRILLSAEDLPGEWDARVALPPDATFVHVRDYYYDWRPRQPATFVIERLDRPGEPAPPATGPSVAALLDGAADQIEHSLRFWDDYQTRLRDRQSLNEFGEPGGAARGVGDLVYSHAFVALPDDHALVVEVDGDVADEWGLQLFSRHWYEPLDYANQVTSRNHRQVHVDDDRRVRLVLAHDDPGVANWVDTDHRAEVLATLRWFRPRSTPEVRQELVALAELSSRLPATTDRRDTAARRDEVAARAAHVAWRYRT